MRPRLARAMRLRKGTAEVKERRSGDCVDLRANVLRKRREEKQQDEG